MSIERTAAGTYKVRWRDIDGRHRARTVRTRDAAERLERQVRGDTDRGLRTDDMVRRRRRDRYTTATWAEAWLAGAHNLRAGGRDLYRRDLDRHVIPHIGEIPVHRLTKADLDKLLAAEAEAGRAASTLHRIWRTLRAMLNAAVEAEVIDRNPIRRVRAPKVPRTEMRFLSAGELERLALAAAQLGDDPARHRPAERALILVAGWGGLRWSEITGLRARHVTGTGVHVVAQLVDGRWEEPKGGQRRFVPLPASVLAELDVPDDPDALVFTSPAGRPLRHANWRRRVWVPAKEAAAVDAELRFHDLRHTAVALAIAGGAHPKAIQERMGHSSIQVTLDMYGHLMPALGESVAADLETLRTEAVGKRLRAV